MRLSEFGNVEKLICIDTGRDCRLTLHKVYDGVIFSSARTMRIIANDGIEKTYSNKRLMRLSEFRQNKLKQLRI